MVIASRTLHGQDKERAIAIPIRIHAPEAASRDWICRFKIEWPDGKVERWGSGVDSVQALVMALQMIAAEVYTSRYHQTNSLAWLGPQKGYGFPVSRNMRDLLVGDDERFF